MKCIAVCVTKSNRSVITDKDTEKCKQYYLKMKRLLISILSQLLIKCDMLTCNIYGKKTRKQNKTHKKTLEDAVFMQFTCYMWHNSCSNTKRGLMYATTVYNYVNIPHEYVDIHET